MTEENLSTETTTKTRRRAIGAARRAATREKLIAAAARVVGELGEDNSKIDDFVAAAGLARGTFYNYYSTREELLEDLWSHVGRDPYKEILTMSAEIEDPAERLTAETRLVLERATTDPTWGWVMHAFSGSRHVVRDMLSYPKPDLLIGQRSGRFEFDDLQSTSDLVVGAVRAALRTILEHGVRPGSIAALSIMLLRALGIDYREARAIVAKPLDEIFGSAFESASQESRQSREPS
jgi:AcrR family transcriptional regulator